MGQGARRRAPSSGSRCSCRRPTRAQAVIALAITRASSQLLAAATGDQHSRRTPSGSRSSEAEGSNSHAWPTSERAATVARITSGLVEVAITAPDAPSTAGIITALVLPERGGPRTITALSGSARIQPPRRTRPR